MCQYGPESKLLGRRLCGTLNVEVIVKAKQSTPVTDHAGPEGSRRVKAPRFLDNGTVWW